MKQNYLLWDFMGRDCDRIYTNLPTPSIERVDELLLIFLLLEIEL